MIRSRVCVLLTLIGGLAAPAGARAQPASPPDRPPTLTLEQALQYAADHYPTIRSALEQVNVSTAGVTAARTAYLPRLDSIWQSNLATTNNVFGQLLPQSVMPGLSGPVLPATSNQGVWSSATGALASWEAFDFGLRGATVAGAEALVTKARAGEALTRLDVQAAVGAAFLSLAAAQQAVAAMQADVDRRDVLARSDPNDGRGVGRDEYRRPSHARYVLPGAMASAPDGAVAAGTGRQRHQHDRAHVRDPRAERSSRMGRCQYGPDRRT
jgi:outer membrane protein TolC